MFIEENHLSIPFIIADLADMLKKVPRVIRGSNPQYLRNIFAAKYPRL